VYTDKNNIRATIFGDIKLKKNNCLKTSNRLIYSGKKVTSREAPQPPKGGVREKEQIRVISPPTP